MNRDSKNIQIFINLNFAVEERGNEWSRTDKALLNTSVSVIGMVNEISHMLTVLKLKSLCMLFRMMHKLQIRNDFEIFRSLSSFKIIIPERKGVLFAFLLSSK